MGLPSGKHNYARYCHGQNRRHDRGKAQACLCGRRSGKQRRLPTSLSRILIVLVLALVGTISIAQAETLRIATFNAELSRKGPGLLLRDIQRGKDPQISAFKQLLNEIRPDIIMLQGVDYDLRHTALDALARDLAAGGLAYPHIFASAPNAGQASGPDVFAAHRLSSRGHWVVPVETPGFGTLRLMTFYATPPLYDGPEDRNGRRNHDEVAFWLEYLARDDSPLPLVLGGTANVDPLNGSGRPEAINALLAHPALQNPFDATPTADFGAASADALRLDYLLPSAGWQIAAHGIVHSPTASRHSLMWVDIAPR